MHLYLHIPFCKQACHYCDFHFSTSLAQKDTLVEALCQEITFRSDYLPDAPLETIYFGGGTPSLLSEGELGRIFEVIYQCFSVITKAEITLEANPDDLSVQHLTMLKKYFNRLSIGLQSFDDGFLRFMNRAHSVSDSKSCVKTSQDIGFENISIDLIYGWKADIWQHDLAQALTLDVPHISAYNLTIEPQTVLGKWLKKGQIAPIDDELSAQQFEYMISTLAQVGYEQYEISNFARNDRYAQHNSCYWKRRPYLGIGPSAHSYNGHSRQYNVSNNALYIKALNNNTAYFEVENLTPIDQANDYLLTSLRTIWGCRLDELSDLLGESFVNKQQQVIAYYLQKSFVEISQNTLFLTPSGKLFADRVAADLFL